ncbi:hypothetical protein Cme02nite_37990 [Catellatospora methionotrophica]|uniref:Helix-turn-helix DNA binding domain protein n=1 Tax=Catellatospora methionotrophica TaxID=121620 RepID=A0A8J3PFQ4_9ACTN|nr:hypothetical protein [Catellatospora methionotrophica]GIG15467.1 hypothetical protein Cme02nite_37990 [Catellatospora methionotrophica]
MPTTAEDLRPFLGPAWDQLTPDQRDRVAEENDRIHARYADPDQEDEHQAALNAAVEYLLGEVTIDDAGASYAAARREAARLLVPARQIAAMASADGMPDAQAARRSGVDRMTLLKDLGKR